MPAKPPDLFGLDTVSEVHLARAPLEKVVTEIQFSDTPALVSPEGEERLAALLPRYPIRRRGQIYDVSILPGSSSVNSPRTSRMFADGDAWSVTVTDTKVLLDTARYESRTDFCDRARELLQAIGEVAAPPIVDRLGIRYIDRLVEPAHLSRLDHLVSPRLRVLDGAAADGVTVEYSVSDSLLRVGENERLKVRSGSLPAGAVFDSSILPLDRPSWVLDIDVFTMEGGLAFDAEDLSERLASFASHAYAFFRWAVSDAFLEMFTEALGVSEVSA